MGIAVATPRCQVCAHSKLGEINRICMDKKNTNGAIGQIFGVHYKSVSRHRNEHLPKAMVEYATQQAAEVLAVETPEAETPQDQINALMTKARSVLDKVEKKKDYTNTIRALREIRGCIELTAKLNGQIDQGATINIFAAPTWIVLQTAIITALEPFPEARAAVLKALPAS
ncbi:hypothetical protein [Lichenicoccus sp.]|uniref:hypothetical protein n=1 Tax=Lichenicoccus sp. TaxID=2781899 RepID=UPI003D09BF8A